MFNLYVCAKDGDKQSTLELTELVVDYGIQALDRLTANVADTAMGQDHFIIGPVVYAQRYMSKHTAFAFYGEMEYYIPRRETRFFIVQKNPAQFARDYDSEVDAQANLNFLMQQATNTLYPTAVTITTKPGFITHFYATFNAYWDLYNGGIGYDFWSQSKEHLGHLKGRCTPGGPLNLCAGKKQAAYEGKIFAQLASQLCGDGYNMRIALRGDTTVHHKGIGRSFIVNVDFILDF